MYTKRPAQPTIIPLSLLLDDYDRYTAAHCRRVARLAQIISLKMGTGEAETIMIARAAALHDIGKLVLPLSIIRKTGALDYTEQVEMQRHPAIAVEMLRPLDYDREVLQIIEKHHERYNGTGYPYGLKGQAIPLGARIVAIADAYDAMTTQRSYHVPMPAEKATAELKALSGIQWDPEVVEAFTSIIGIRKFYSNATVDALYS